MNKWVKLENQIWFLNDSVRLLLWTESAKSHFQLLCDFNTTTFKTFTFHQLFHLLSNTVQSYILLGITHVVHVWNDMIAIKWQNWNLWVIFFFSFGMCIIHRREYVSPVLGSLVTCSYCSEPRCTVVLQERWVWSNCLISNEQAWTAEAHITCIVRWLRRLHHWFESTA